MAHVAPYKVDAAMKQVTIYTDGACSGNPGPGGWGAILQYGDKAKELSGGHPETTNNRMELMSVIAALEALKEPCRVELFSDSQYIVNAVNEGWLSNWQRRGWRRKEGEVKNLDLWQRLVPLLESHEVTMTWVKGHADNEFNNRCDELAVAERLKYAEKTAI
jgi:ribonuclease HI